MRSVKEIFRSRPEQKEEEAVLPGRLQQTDMSYQVIVLDLDGTLLNSQKKISARTKQALIDAQKQGKKVILASGRPTAGVWPTARELELERYEGYILSFNGGMITDCKTGEIIHARQIPVELNAAVIEEAKRQSCVLMTYSDELITNQADYRYVQLEYRGCQLPIHEFQDPEEMKAYVNFPVAKFIFTAEGEELAGIEPQVREHLGPAFAVYRSDPYFLEIVPAGVDKGQALAHFTEVTGYGPEEMISCGDGYNDMPLIRYAGLGVAMANAIPEIREAADHITASNDEDGVALVVEKFMLDQ